MYDLPKREKELEVEVEDGAVKLYVEPLTDEQYFAVNEASIIEGEGGDARIVFRTSRVHGLFADRIRRVEGVEIDGAAIDLVNPDHIARIPQPWKAIAITRLIRYAMGLTETERGNSRGRAEPSTAAETRSPA